MTSEEYKHQKQALEQEMKELEDKWLKENEDIYSVNAGKYYKGKSRDNTIGVIDRFCSGRYYCREIECSADGLFIDTSSEWSTQTLLSQYEFISRDEFIIILNNMISEFDTATNKLFYL